MSKRGNGEGSIYYSDKLKRWIGQVSLGYKNDGSLKRKSVYGKTRKEVNEKIQKVLNDFNEGKLVDKSSYTLSDIIELLINEQYTNNLISSTTYKRKTETLKKIQALSIGNMKIQSIEAKDINFAFSTLSECSNSCIDKVTQLTKAAFNKALILNIINYSPFDRKGLIIKPRSFREDKKVDALTTDEQKLLLDELNKKYDYYSDELKLALFTGMRIGEILALTKTDIDFNNKIIHIQRTLTRDENDKVIIGKTTKTYAGTRDIPITPLIEELLYNRCINTSSLLFTFDGKLIDASTINIHFKKICKNAGIRICTVEKKKHKDDIKVINLKSSNVNTHMLRHTYATRCIESGMTAVVLSKLLGHTDVDTTLNTYTSVFNKFKENEVNKYLEYMNSIH